MQFSSLIALLVAAAPFSVARHLERRQEHSPIHILQPFITNSPISPLFAKRQGSCGIAPNICDDTTCCRGGQHCCNALFEGCCPGVTYCVIVDGEPGCCPAGQTCVGNGDECASAGYELCPGEDFCCPAGDTCYTDVNGDLRCSSDGGPPPNPFPSEEPLPEEPTPSEEPYPEEPVPSVDPSPSEEVPDFSSSFEPPPTVRPTSTRNTRSLGGDLGGEGTGTVGSIETDAETSEASKKVVRMLGLGVIFAVHVVNLFV